MTYSLRLLAVALALLGATMLGSNRASAQPAIGIRWKATLLHPLPVAMAQLHIRPAATSRQTPTPVPITSSSQLQIVWPAGATNMQGQTATPTMADDAQGNVFL